MIDVFVECTLRAQRKSGSEIQLDGDGDGTLDPNGDQRARAASHSRPALGIALRIYVGINKAMQLPLLVLLDAVTFLFTALISEIEIFTLSANSG